MSASELSRDDSSSSLATATAANEVAVRLPYQLQTGMARPEEEEQFGPTSLRLSDIRIVLKHVDLADRDRPGMHSGGDPDLSTPIYRSWSSCRSSGRHPRRAIRQGPRTGRAGGDDALSIRTQQELLKARLPLRRVVDELRLDQSIHGAGTRRREPPKVGGCRRLMALRQAARATTSIAAGGLPQDDQPERAAQGADAAVISKFLNSLTVEPVRSSPWWPCGEHQSPSRSALASTTVQSPAPWRWARLKRHHARASWKTRSSR